MDTYAKGRGHRALRRHRHSLPHHAYLLTTVTAGREPAFARRECASAACAVLGEARLWRDSNAHCWVLMPDHLHVLVTLGRAEPLSRLAGRIKAASANAANRALRRHGQPVWARGFHDRLVRQEESLRALARYVIANRVRAGLTETPGRYPYWDAAWLQVRGR